MHERIDGFAEKKKEKTEHFKNARFFVFPSRSESIKIAAIPSKTRENARGIIHLRSLESDYLSFHRKKS